MEYRTLDVTVLSAEDLKKVTHFGKMQPFAVVWVDYNQRRSTRVDKNGNTNPSWNDRISLAVPERLFHQSGSSLHLEIYNKGSVVGNKFVGMAVIPLSELLQHSDGKEALMYQLRRKSGKVKGAVKLSVHVGEKTSAPTASSEPVTAYPYSDQKPYPAQAYGGYPQAYPPQQQYQPYPPQGYYPPQQGYYQQPSYMQPPRRPGMMGGGMGGMGTGLLAGALGGLLVGEMMDDAFDGGYGGGYDGGYDGGGGFDGGGFDGGF